MLIRLANFTDIPQILQLIKEVVPVMNAAGNFQWDNAYPNAAVFERDITLNQLWVADGDDGIAGVIAITTDQDPEYADVGWDINETAIVVHRIAVSINHQGKGVAARLMQQAEQVANTRGLKKIRIDTNVVNGATNHLFPKLGYVYAGEISLATRPGMRFSCYEKILR
ncbi:GNAT family N-acetyltransferase [Mucilaginibacter sp. UR6-11]|uniref:GNAT family N-acetyltransferase n=1 Tax=Mucilaginibacter sp. UR6-11 TaxID=1435644 RepID=UPI001E604349|nr:GNAT family N-acetyltransferase [Mucilaginibacter sp. UR6-11]MCC8425375.1 GNAT family N-acetyltransferase [Mucilaginibacter sp. UR6-11]